MNYAAPPGPDQPPAPGHAAALPAGWTLSQTIGGLLGGLLLSSVAAALVLAMIGTDGILGEAIKLAGDTAGATRLDPAILVLIATDAVLVAVAASVAANARAGGIWSQLGFKAIPPGSAKTIAKVYGIYFLSALTIAMIADPDQQDVASGLGADGGAAAAVIAGAGIVLVAPIAEEIFFRGFLFGGLRNRTGLWPAIVISSLIFGALHFDPSANANLAAAGQLTILGGLMAWLYDRTGSLWAPIIIHVFNNSLAFTILLAG